jgi:hypothetical protein
MNPKLMFAMVGVVVGQNLCVGAKPAPAVSDGASKSATTAASPSATSVAGAQTQRGTVAFTPYIWLTSINGTMGVRGVSTDVDASFLDILDKSDSIIGLMGALDVEVDRFVMQINAAYTKAEVPDQRGRAINGPSGGSGSVAAQINATASNLWVEGFAGYRVVDTRRAGETPTHFTLDAFGGVRVTDMEMDLDVTASANATLPTGEVLQAGTQRGISEGQTWVEPFVGLRGALELHENWVFSLRADVGGFGVDDSDFSWQAVAALGYRWRRDNWMYSVFAGYRALGQDYSSSTFTWDAVTHGPMLGMQFAYRF